MSRNITVALAGNPNCGKSALFNVLTGSRQRVGNWPGVTVSRQSGYFTWESTRVEVVDLPGTYSVSVLGDGAIDEKIACDFLLSRQAELVVNVLDGTNLIRNLYLTLQLLEMKIPVIIAVNMMDLVKSRGITINLKRLQKLLGCKVVPLVASQGKGVDELKGAILQMAQAPTVSNFAVIDSPELLASIDFLSTRIFQKNQTQDEAHAKWLALRLLESDYYANQAVDEQTRNEAKTQIKRIEQVLHDEPDILIADARYHRASQIADHVITITKTPRQSATETIDQIVLHRFLGIPIFLFVMYLMFVFAINIGGAFQDFFDISSTVIFVDGLSECQIVIKSLRRFSAVNTSNAENGSSINNTSGSTTKARASPTRCDIPPDNSFG
jgi:ferrous iron transport protein B